MSGLFAKSIVQQEVHRSTRSASFNNKAILPPGLRFIGVMARSNLVNSRANNQGVSERVVVGKLLGCFSAHRSEWAYLVGGFDRHLFRNGRRLVRG